MLDPEIEQVTHPALYDTAPGPTAACTVELAGVLAIGWSLLYPARFPAATVWSGFGSGYGCFPLALPLLGLLYQRSRRPKLEAWRTSPST